MAWLWRPLVTIAVHEELAAAEGIPTRRLEAALILLLAFTVAIAMKIVGVLLIIAFLVMPAAAARPLARTPEAMVGIAAGIGAVGAVAGLMLSYVADLPAGPAIVLVLTAMCTATILPSAFRTS